MDLHGKVVIITGASAGIGAATARAFAAAGALTVLAARNAAALHAVAAECAGALSIPTDVSDADACRALVAAALARHGRIDILINNAGVGLAGPVAELSVSDLERTLAVDLFGPLTLIQAVVPIMRRQRSGQIINVSSVLAAQTLPYLGGYAAAKAALERLSDALRIETAADGIVVTTIRPGTTATGFSANRLGRGSEQRRVNAAAASPAQVAATILSAARHGSRLRYVRFADRLALWLAALAPRLTERLLRRAISWRGEG
jgi:short-subunit dehydrogenase